MKKHKTAAFAICAFALSPLTAFAMVDEAEIDNYCRQLAEEEKVAADALDDYVANCVAENMKALMELEAKEEKAD
jgi:hypothetical protein